MTLKPRSHITLVPFGGLGNRLKAISAGIRLARQTHSDIDIYWVVDSGLACRFDQLFLPIDTDGVKNGFDLELLDAVAARCADPAIADDLKYVLATANAMAAGRYQVAYCPSLVRGQGYYTGMVFEVTCPQFSGAVAGGGRYDNMVGKFLGVQVPAVGFSIGFERVCGILLEQGYQIPGAKQKIALLYGKDVDFPAVLRKAAALREQYNVTVLPQGKKLGKQLGQLEAAGFAGAAFMDKDEVKIFAQQ